MKVRGTLLSLVFVLTASNVQAKSFWDSTKESLRDYGIPCVLAVGVSHLVAKEEKMGIGLAACAGAAGVTYLKNKEIKKIDENHKQLVSQMDEMKKELRTEVKRTIIGDAKEEMVLEMKQEVYSEINKSLTKDKEFIGKMLSQIKVEFDAYKAVMEQVLADKLVDYRGEISVEIKQALMEGPFIPMLEAKIVEKLKGEHNKMIDKRKSEIVKACVEEALDEIVVKEIAVPKN